MIADDSSGGGYVDLAQVRRRLHAFSCQIGIWCIVGDRRGGIPDCSGVRGGLVLLVSFSFGFGFSFSLALGEHRRINRRNVGQFLDTEVFRHLEECGSGIPTEYMR